MPEVQQVTSHPVRESFQANGDIPLPNPKPGTSPAYGIGEVIIPGSVQKLSGCGSWGYWLAVALAVMGNQ